MIFLSQTLRLRCASLFHSDIYIFLSPFATPRLPTGDGYGCRDRTGCTAPRRATSRYAGATPRRICRTFQKPYGESYLRSRQLDSFRHLRDAPFWRRCRASGRAVTMGGTGDSLKNVVSSSLLLVITSASMAWMNNATVIRLFGGGLAPQGASSWGGETGGSDGRCSGADWRP